MAWNEADAGARAAALRVLGYDVDASPVQTPFRDLVPEGTRAVVIDLSRLPSHGRDVGVALRTAKRTRHVPIVFAGGAPEKVERVRELLPDAVFVPWERISGALRKAKPLRHPIVPSSNLAGYASTPLPRKLGIKEGTFVALVGAPEGFEALLGADGVIRRGNRGRRDLTIVFVHDANVEDAWDRLARDANVDDVWLVWAKKASPLHAGVTQALVRKPGLARGFVDFKVCAVDETWAALRFKRAVNRSHTCRRSASRAGGRAARPGGRRR